MNISWGYSPKIEKYIPLGDFPIDNYFIVAKQAIENLGWKLSHLSKTELIAYTPISLQSYSEVISIKIVANFAIVKSECIGLQMLFTDYGKNDQNLESFFHEFEYVEFHLKDLWDESLIKHQAFVATQDQKYLEKEPLVVKNKIKNVLYLLLPQKGYVVTPIIIYLCILYYLFYYLIYRVAVTVEPYGGGDLTTIKEFYEQIFSNNKSLVLERLQVWRLFTYQFVHLSFLHLFFNMYVLVYAGLMIEHKLGVKKFSLIYLLSGLCAGVASIVVHNSGFGIGASGPIMGLSGSFLALLLTQSFEKNAARGLFVSVSIFTVITLLNGLQAGIDNAAHVGGLLMGFVATIILSGKFVQIEIKKEWRYAVLAAFIGISIGVAVMFASDANSKEFSRLEDLFEENSRDYQKVNEIPKNLSTLQKIKIVRTYGMELWQRNGLIVLNMRTLELDEKHNNRRKYYEEMTHKMLRLTNIRYANYKDKQSVDQAQLAQLEREISALRIEAKENAGIEFP